MRWAVTSITPSRATTSIEAIEHFERAAYLDPSFALTHSALGYAYASRVMKGFGEPEDHDTGDARLLIKRSRSIRI